MFSPLATSMYHTNYCPSFMAHTTRNAGGHGRPHQAGDYFTAPSILCFKGMEIFNEICLGFYRHDLMRLQWLPVRHVATQLFIHEPFIGFDPSRRQWRTRRILQFAHTCRRSRILPLQVPESSRLDWRWQDLLHWPCLSCRGRYFGEASGGAFCLRAGWQNRF